jgi:hypothetical protein
MEVSWNKCTGDKWCSLNTVNLEDSHFDGMEGVYVIWHGGQTPKTVRVGQGIIRDRLAAHRTDNQIQSYSNLGLYVTWAAVAVRDRDGVEAYLAAQLNPLVGERFPQRRQIIVNLP